MGLEDLDVDEMIQDSMKTEKQEIADLESRSKELHERIATENFTVNSIIARTRPTSFTINSEMVMGARSPTYEGGFTSQLVLKVSPDNKNIPIKSIIFNGFSIIKAGDYIAAQILKYETEIITPRYSGNGNKRFFYIDRDFNIEEDAIELALLSEDGSILRKDRSINYRNFTKKD
jgi:hypothetical protein